MSGHSKWHQIRHKKTATDAKKAAVFARLAREITVAAREGQDPSVNAALARVIERALAANMPKDNIDRAVAKAAGADSAQLHTLLLEAYGPDGVGIVITAVTDNRNRTIAEVKHVLTTHGASLGKANSVLWQFEQREGQLLVKQPIPVTDETREKLEALLEAVTDQDDVTAVTTTAATHGP